MSPTERANRAAGLRGVMATLEKIDLSQPATEATAIYPHVITAKRLLATQIRCLEEYQRREPDLLRLVEMEAKKPGSVPAYDRLLIDPIPEYDYNQIEEGEQP